MIVLSCQKCGASLQVTDDLEIFACAHCGTSHRVDRGGGIVSLRKVEGHLESMAHGVDRQTAELALARLKDELAECKREGDSLDAKIKAAQTTVRSMKSASFWWFAGAIGCVIVVVILNVLLFLMITAGVICCVAGLGHVMGLRRSNTHLRDLTARREKLQEEWKRKTDEYNRWYSVVDGGSTPE
jgi:hypothetical protein